MKAATVLLCTQAAFTCCCAFISNTVVLSSLSINNSRSKAATRFAAAAQTYASSSSGITSELYDNSSNGRLLDEVDKLLLSSSTTSIDGEVINQSILAKIDADVTKDVSWAKQSPLPFEKNEHNNIADAATDYSETPSSKSIIEYEPILITVPPSTDSSSSSSTKATIALRTTSSSPLLSSHEIQLLRRAVEIYWNDLDNNNSDSNLPSSKSRFTYQRKGNSEAHLSDVVRYFEHQNHHGEEKLDVSTLVDKLLLDRIYPWIRDGFLSKESSIHSDCGGNDDELSLYIYDAIFIRYNATEAENNIGAGQPLHRDLGYVSVNIMLNTQEEFQGGGTFFENQLLPVVLNDGRDGGSTTTAAAALPLKPLGPGHAIAHKSSDRHAGSATIDGVRDILVLFVAVAAGSSGGAPAWEVNARLKSTARASSSSDSLNSSIGDQLLRRVRHHRLAIQHVPNDGEAWHYLGMALLDYHNYLQYEQQEDYTTKDSIVLRLAISCLETATIYTPCDGRLQNNLGIALERLYEFHLQTLGNDLNEDEMTILRSRIATAYERSIQIHSLCNQIGCDVKADYESVCLNYGLYLSKLDDFENAIDILSLVVTEDADDDDDEDTSAIMEEEDASHAARRRVLSDIGNLLGFCSRQQMKRNS